jgi:hypothetical protein
LEVGAQFHDPAASSPEKDVAVPIDQKGFWASGPFWTFGRNVKSLALAGYRISDLLANILVITSLFRLRSFLLTLKS